MTPVTQQWWDENAAVYDAILAHPFLVGLTDGSLPEVQATILGAARKYLAATPRG